MCYRYEVSRYPESACDALEARGQYQIDHRIYWRQRSK